MKIKLNLICAISILVFFIGACEKENGSNYVKATINGNLWNSNSVSVETTAAGGGVEPVKITGVLNGELINIRIAQSSPGTYPFRLNGIKPVVLISFTVERFESSHRVKWSTGTETNVASFTVEGSTDGLNWTPVASTNATGSNSNYQVVPANDVAAGTTWYYRLKVIDTNASFSYSSIQLITGNYVVSYRPASGTERAGYEGNLEIVTHDKGRKIITGRFNCKVKTTSGQLYTITNGEFRASY